MKKAIEKKECFRPMHLHNSLIDIEHYIKAKKSTKRALSEARGRMYDGLYQQLGTKV
jgi:hypothetical protein